MSTSSEPAWVQHAIWWRLYPLGFVGAYPASEGASETGDRLTRIIPWLDHALELGASGIALGPIFASLTHGYDTIDHRRIDPRLGDAGDFDKLIAEARDRGLRIQLDGVFNHVGLGHEAVTKGWLRMVDGRPVPFEGHDILPTLDHDLPEVQDFTVEVMRHWLDRGADAWRLDAAYAVAPRFWAQVIARVRETHPDAWFEAEVIHGDYAAFVEDSTVDTVTQYELWKAVWSSINDGNFHELAWTLGRHNALLETFAPATFIGNHDVTRIATRITDPRHLAHAIVLLAVLGGTPTVYAGDELGMRGLKEERVGGDDAIRPEFPANPGPRDPDTETTFALHKRLLGLRRRHPWLHRATATPVTVENRRIRLRITDGDDILFVELNLSDDPVTVERARVLDQDDRSAQTPGQVAPHGWQITA